MSDETALKEALQKNLPILDEIVKQCSASLRTPAILVLGAGISLPGLIGPEVQRTLINCLTYGREQFKVLETVQRILSPNNDDKNFYIEMNTVTLASFFQFLKELESNIEMAENGEAIEPVIKAALQDPQRFRFVHEIIRKNHEYKNALGIERSVLEEFALNFSNLCNHMIHDMRKYHGQSNVAAKSPCTTSGVAAEMSEGNMVALIINTNWDSFFEEHISAKKMENRFFFVTRKEDLHENALVESLEPLSAERMVHLYKPHGTVGHDKLTYFQQLRTKGSAFPTEFVFFSEVNEKTNYLSKAFREEILETIMRLRRHLSKSFAPVIISGFQGRSDTHIWSLLESIGPIRSSFVFINPYMRPTTMQQQLHKERPLVFLRLPSTFGLLLVYAYLLWRSGIDCSSISKRLLNLCPQIREKAKDEMTNPQSQFRYVKQEVGTVGVLLEHDRLFKAIAQAL